MSRNLDKNAYQAFFPNNTSTEGSTQEKQNTALTTAPQENIELPESVTPLEEPVEHDDGDEPVTAGEGPQGPFSIAAIVIAVLLITAVEALAVAPLLLFKRKH